MHNLMQKLSIIALVCALTAVAHAQSAFNTDRSVTKTSSAAPSVVIDNSGSNVVNPATPAPAPEPATLALIGAGSLALLAARRRNRK